MKRISMSDIAKVAGVSKNTVSLALRNDPQIPEKTRLRIQNLANKMGYETDPIVNHLMAQLRAQSTPDSPRATLALINGNANQHAFKEHPTIPSYVEGCKRRASKMGYGLDTFWLHDPDLNGERLNRILKARGIRGIIIVGLMTENRLPARFMSTWENYPCVVTGARTRNPALSFSSTDHHIITLRAFEHAIDLGYKRPGLVLDSVINDLVEGRFIGGYQIGQNRIPAKNRLKPFFNTQAARKDLSIFRKWLDKEKPDVIFTLYHDVKTWLEKCGYRVPENMGLIQLEWREDHAHWAGMNQHNDITGEAAIDMVISMIHNNEAGIPEYPRATLIGGSWVDGQTVTKQA